MKPERWMILSTLFFVLVILVGVNIGNWEIYRRIKVGLDEEVGRRLIAVAQTILELEDCGLRSRMNLEEEIIVLIQQVSILIIHLIE